MTETSPTTICTPTNVKRRDGSCGTLTPSTEARVVDLTTGKDVDGPNRVGELYVRGAQVMKGYIDDPVATRETIDPEGWLHTGDIVYYDEDEFFYVVDRAKDLIKVKGMQVPIVIHFTFISQFAGTRRCRNNSLDSSK